MASLQFKKDNLVAKAVYNMVFTTKGLEKIKKEMLSHYNVKNLSEIRSKGKTGLVVFNALDALEKLPLVPIEKCETGWYTRSLVPKNEMVYAIGGAQRFAPEQQLIDYAIDQEELLSSWQNLETIRRGFSKITDIATVSREIAQAENAINKSVRLKKRWEKKDIEAVKVSDDLEENFIQNESAALFVRRKSQMSKQVQEGFLGSKGDIVPLARARLFDSEDAAKAFLRRTNTAYYFLSFQVVNVKLQISGLGASINGTENAQNVSDSVIFEACARVQKEQIQEALKQATRDKLLSRLEELDAEQSQDQQASVTPPPKRKM